MDQQIDETLRQVQLFNSIEDVKEDVMIITFHLIRKSILLIGDTVINVTGRSNQIWTEEYWN